MSEKNELWELQPVLRARLRQFFNETGVLQKDFAARCGISTSKVSQTLTGRLPVTVGMVYVLHYEYKLSMKRFLAEVDNR